MSEPYYADDLVTLYHGDCLDVLRAMPDASVDAVVTDPPYGLEFMGKEWDGANGFRRSLNPNDADRDNAFGRTSRTSPEYRTSAAKAGMSKPGIGERETGWPSHLGGLNPKCRSCNHWQRGANPCSCEAPDFPNERLPRLHSFQEWCEAWSRECLRVLKPGGHLLAFGGTRTHHRLACAVEDAGFEIRDSIAWLYGSGFPKSLDVSKAIDKAAGVEREVVGPDPFIKMRNKGSARFNGDQYAGGSVYGGANDVPLTAPATPDAERWQGWGTALKPAHEPIVVARKPLVGTVAANVLTHGTGALNVDGCRVEHASAADLAESVGKNRHADFGSGPRENKVYGADLRDRGAGGNYDGAKGRWPANVVLDESQAAVLDEQSGDTGANGGSGSFEQHAWMRSDSPQHIARDNQGGASRFFYVAKADASERVRIDGIAHPTVKPLALMRWLVRLVTPPGGTVLEPFAGSGTTVEACLLEGFACIAIEREVDYLPLIVQRINRRRDPVAAVQATDGLEGTLFEGMGA